MKQYLDLVRKVIEHGVDVPDRTGVGTRKLFGESMKFDLNKGFPLVTAKFTPFKTIATELCWFLRGRTDLKWLQERGCNIWDSWRKPGTDDMGPIYGFNWRNFGGKGVLRRQIKPELRDGLKRSYLDIANGLGKGNSGLGKTWEGMIGRCYDKKNISYSFYGGKGVFVCDEWLEFKRFEEDVKYIPGWENKIKDESVRYVLDKDRFGNGFLYSQSDCCWVTDLENSQMKTNKRYTVEKNGLRYTFSSPKLFCQQHKLENKNFSDLWTGAKNATTREGFKLVDVVDLDKGIDQLGNVLESLISDPYGRRHIVTAWDPLTIDQCALPPCHCFMQFDVQPSNKEHNSPSLNLQVYQRSCDLFLGVPFNIASYALLLQLIARHCHYRPGVLTWVGGDVHLYRNHGEQVGRLLSRETFSLPKISIARADKLEQYEPFDFRLLNYTCGDHIPAPVAV